MVVKSRRVSRRVSRRRQGYNARLDESLGMRHRNRKLQSLKDRRNESKGTEKSMGKRAYRKIDKSGKKKSRRVSRRI